MVVAKKSSAQMDQRKFPMRVFACSAASAAPMALLPPDCEAIVDSDLGRAVFSTDSVIWSIVGVRRLDAAFSSSDFRLRRRLLKSHEVRAILTKKRRHAAALENYWLTPLTRKPPSTTII